MLKIANKDNFIPKGSYNPHNVKAYLIGNEFGLICIAYASYESEALDYAVDAGLMDSELMSVEDYNEYSGNQWDDSYILAGNASEPFWSESLWINLH